jgi:hypothetical protein
MKRRRVDRFAMEHGMAQAEPSRPSVEQMCGGLLYELRNIGWFGR